MKELNEKEWKPFTLEDIFTVSAGKRLETRNKEAGIRPFIGATDNNNGVTGFVNNDNESKDLNVIGVNYNGAPCITFYHPYECIFTDDVKRLHFINYHDSRDTLLGFKPIIEKQKKKYGYGYKFNEKRMLRQKLMVPVDSNSSKPDYPYIEQYVSGLMEKEIKRYKEYIKGRISELGNYVIIPALSEKTWKPIELTDIFDSITRGKRLKKSDQISGNIPYVSSTSDLNGNDGTCGNMEDVRKFHGCLTLANSGSVGSCFYHPYEFIASDHVTALERNNNTNEFVYLFLSLLTSRVGEKYNFNREINDIRIKRERIMIPVNNSGEPDYAYMEQYSKNMMLRKYQQYLDFLNRKNN